MTTPRDAMTPVHRLRAGCLLLTGATGAAAAAAVLTAWAAPSALAVAAHPSGADLTQLLVLAGTFGLVLVLAIGAAGAVVSSLGALARRRHPARGLPRPLAALERALVPLLVRRLAAAALGVGMVGGVAAPATAAPGPPAPAPDAVVSVVSVVPDWPAEGAAWEAPPAPSRASRQAPALTPSVRPAPSAEVVVVRGDCLWDIVRRQLPPDAPDSAVAAQWPRWWAANRATIGADPDVLLPGQVLRAPALAP